MPRPASDIEFPKYDPTPQAVLDLAFRGLDPGAIYRDMVMTKGLPPDKAGQIMADAVYLCLHDRRRTGEAETRGIGSFLLGGVAGYIARGMKR